MFNELVVYLLVRERLGQGDTNSSLQVLRRHILERNWDALVGSAARTADSAIIFGLPLAFALSHGVLRGSAADCAREILVSDYVWGFERPVHRLLEIALACRIADLPPRVGALDLARSSSLTIPPCPLTSSRDAYYGFAHSAVYLALATDGYLPSAGALESLEGGLCWTLAGRDMDLALELVLAAVLLGHSGPAQERIVDEARHQFLASGMVKTKASGAIDAFVQACPEEETIGRNYHTMIMAGLALSATDGMALDSCHPTHARDVLRAAQFGEICVRAREYDLRNVANLSTAVGDRGDDPRWDRQRDSIDRFLHRAELTAAIGN